MYKKVFNNKIYLTCFADGKFMKIHKQNLKPTKVLVLMKSFLE